MVTSLCADHKQLKMSKEKKNRRTPAPFSKEIRKLLSNLSNISSGMAKMISWKKAGEVDEEAVWKKSIIRGGKCRPLDFSGQILYDSEGNQLPVLPPVAAPGAGVRVQGVDPEGKT